MNLSEIGWESVDWINVALDGDKWRVLGKLVIIFRVPPPPKRGRISCLVEEILAYQEGVCSKELVG